jgi:UV DNA damage endonuclease
MSFGWPWPDPLFHISSALSLRQDGNQPNHHDFIDPEDLPEFWLSQDITVEFKAKAKDLAVLKLMEEVNKST